MFARTIMRKTQLKHGTCSCSTNDGTLGRCPHCYGFMTNAHGKHVLCGCRTNRGGPQRLDRCKTCKPAGSSVSLVHKTSVEKRTAGAAEVFLLSLSLSLFSLALPFSIPLSLSGPLSISLSVPSLFSLSLSALFCFRAPMQLWLMMASVYVKSSLARSLSFSLSFSLSLSFALSLSFSHSLSRSLALSLSLCLALCSFSLLSFVLRALFLALPARSLARSAPSRFLPLSCTHFAFTAIHAPKCECTENLTCMTQQSSTGQTPLHSASPKGSVDGKHCEEPAHSFSADGKRQAIPAGVDPSLDASPSCPHPMSPMVISPVFLSLSCSLSPFPFLNLSCSLSFSLSLSQLDRQLLALPRLTDLIVGDNNLSDLHTGAVLKALANLEVFDIRGNSALFDAEGSSFTNPRRVPRNVHAVRQLEKRGCVVLVDNTALRAPSCTCCQ